MITPKTLTLTIIIITVLFSLLTFSNRSLFSQMLFNPFSIKHSRQYWRFFSYGLIHADLGHLFINMFVLWSFGKVAGEAYYYVFNWKWSFMFLLLYIGGIIISVLPSYFKHRNNPAYNAVGASGAVSAIVFTSILFIPTGKIYIFFIPIGIPAFIFGGLYLVYSWYMGRRGKGNIGHDAHFWGAVFGIVFTIAAKPDVLKIFISQLSDYSLF